MNSFTKTPNSYGHGQTDDHEQKKSQTEPTTAVSEALISLVQRAKHLKIDLRSPTLTKSCPIITRPQPLTAASMGGSIATVTTSTNTNNSTSIRRQPIGNRLQPTKSKARGFGPAVATTGRSVAVPPTTTTATSTLRKMRKIDAQLGQHVAGSTGSAQAPPPPPPPSPRSPLMTELSQAIQMADALKDEYKRTDVLTNHIVHEAMCINEELNMQWRHQRDLDLVQQIEMATDSHGLNLLLAKDELTEMKTRCLRAISQETAPSGILNQGTQTTSPLMDKSSELVLAINQMRKLMSNVSEHRMTDAFEETNTYRPKETLLQITDRIDEMRYLMFTLNAEGPYCEMRMEKLRIESERNAVFYKLMASLEHELTQMIIHAPQLVLKEAPEEEK